MGFAVDDNDSTQPGTGLDFITKILAQLGPEWGSITFVSGSQKNATLVGILLYQPTPGGNRLDTLKNVHSVTDQLIRTVESIIF